MGQGLWLIFFNEAAQDLEEHFHNKGLHQYLLSERKDESETLRRTNLRVREVEHMKES